MKPRFQFKMKNMMIVIALLAAPLLFLTMLLKGDGPTILFLGGSVTISQDGTIESRGGTVRIIEGDKQVDVQGDRIVVKKDGTAEVFDKGTIKTFAVR